MFRSPSLTKLCGPTAPDPLSRVRAPPFSFRLLLREPGCYRYRCRRHRTTVSPVLRLTRPDASNTGRRETRQTGAQGRTIRHGREKYCRNRKTYTASEWPFVIRSQGRGDRAKCSRYIRCFPKRIGRIRRMRGTSVSSVGHGAQIK